MDKVLLAICRGRIKFKGLQGFDKFCRDSSNHGIRSNVFCDDGTGSHYSAIANGHTGEHGCHVISEFSYCHCLGSFRLQK